MSAGLQSWIGREAVVQDTIALAPAERLSATLGHASSRVEQGSELPPCWHWLYFLEASPAQNIAVDGHPEKGGFLPPVELPRRMWAGSRLRFLSPLKVGDRAQRKTTITDIRQRHGRSGELVFVTLRHQIYRGAELLLEELQDIVYREPVALQGPPVHQPSAREPAREPHWSRTLQIDPVLLFRYCALTFNAHRIHYDRDYAHAQEGYAGLVVQGPLSATLLLDLMHQELPDVRLSDFRFRGVSPLTDVAPLNLAGCLHGNSVQLWASAAGATGMEAEATVIAE